MFKCLFVITIGFFFWGFLTKNSIMCGICFGLMVLFAILDTIKGKLIEHILRRR